MAKLTPGRGAINRLRDTAGDNFKYFSRWLRESMERENLIAGFKTMSWLVPMTLLIWVYAEREQIRTVGSQTIPIDVRSNDPNIYVRLEVPEDANITADLKGPQGRIEQVRTLINPKDGKPSIVLIIPDNLTPGTTHEIDAAQLLNDHPTFAAHGVTGSNCKPARLRVLVDVYEERELEVQKPASVTNLVGTPVFVPARVEVRAPSLEFRRAGVLTADADFEQRWLAVPGMKEEMVSVRVPQIPGATISPPQVKANFEVRRADERFEIRSMPVWVKGPPFLLNDYIVECPATVSGIWVVGPPDKIEQLRTNATTPVAVLQVTSDDRPGPNTERIERRLQYELPEGVSPAPDEAPRSISFQLISRNPDR